MKAASIKKTVTAWLVMIGITLPMLLPVFAYAVDDDYKIVMDGNEYIMAVDPYEGEAGMMVGAADIADAFSLDYYYNGENKSFEIYDELHGTVILMHNATQFFSGDTIYDCAPAFCVYNGAPMVEIDFFTRMYGASYELVDNTFYIYPYQLSDDVAKLNIDGSVTQLYVEPFYDSRGLITDLESLAAAFGIGYDYNRVNEMVTLTDDNGEVVLTNGSNTFTSYAGEFVCGGKFFIENNVPLIDVEFFARLFNSSYSYDEDSKTLEIIKDMPMEEDEEAVVMAAVDSTLSGVVSYEPGAPANGLDVQLILQ